MREQNTQAQEKKLYNDTHPLSAHPHPNKNQPPLTYHVPPSFDIPIQWTWHSWYKRDNLINVEV